VPDWVARMLRTAVQVGLGTLAWAVIKVVFLRDVTPEQDLAIQALLVALGTVAVSALQNAAEQAGTIPTILKPANAKTARVAKPG
jgi:predicted membrane-bound spermidine synthase